MSKPIEDYALIGDCQTAALVARDGSIDWLCLPRFDSPACFASLLGNEENGFFKIAPAGEIRRVTRRYRGDTLVLETEYVTDGGVVAVIDFMPPRGGRIDLLRIVEGRSGSVTMDLEIRLRFDYGRIVPWVRATEDGILATAGPDMVRLRTEVPLTGRDFTTVSRFEVRAGQRIPIDLVRFPSHEPAPPPIDAMLALEETEEWWLSWSRRSTYRGPHREAVMRSLITLKALTYEPTGGIVAAPTTSLPEQIGGTRNWDYRYCWIRDATFTLYALIGAGYLEEARSFREWLLRAAAGKPSQLHIMYGISGESRLPEYELEWLGGYEGSAPVRIGNLAYRQRQLDVYGEILDTMHLAWRSGLPPAAEAWNLEHALVEYLASIWELPDEGIWEVRGPRRHFTHSKVMAWLALDRAVKGIEHFRLDGPLERWRALRDTIHADVCAKGYNAERGSFVQYYGSDRLDASLLALSLVGFLPIDDPRIRGTIAAIERELCEDGFVARYLTSTDIDGLPPGEGRFLLCTFWLADNFVLQGRRAEAERLFEKILAIRNDVGLLSEGYDPERRRLVGNFPQAFSHIGLINTAFNLAVRLGPSVERSHT